MDRRGSDGLEMVDVFEVAGETDDETDHKQHWIPRSHRLVSGLVGLNVMLLGAALVTGDTFNPMGLQHQEPELFLLVLMALSLLWMLWYLLWARRQPGPPPHTDHHAGSATLMVVLMFFAGFSLLLCLFRMGYYLLLTECQPFVKIISSFIQAPFCTLQTYLLWVHAKDCIHKYKVLNRFGLIITLCGDVLLWFCAVTDDSVHSEIELEKQDKDGFNSTLAVQEAGQGNGTVCQCSASSVCLTLRKGYEILHPFNMEFSLLATCMLYVMWKNVGRHITIIHAEQAQKTTLHSVLREVLLGPVLGLLVLLSGASVFVLYHVWVEQNAKRLTAFVLFYSFHLGLLPMMALCSLAGLMVQKEKGVKQGLEKQNKTRKQKESNHNSQTESKNPTKRLDVMLLLGTAVGQLSLSYLSFVAALALAPSDIVSILDLSYSLLCLIELVLQNIFIIKGLHRHIQSYGNTHLYVKSHTHLHNLSSLRTNEKDKNVSLKTGKQLDETKGEKLQRTNDTSLTPRGNEGYNIDHWNKKVFQEICVFLVLSNITLWVIPAFGAHPELESGLGKQFFGVSVWFILVNLSQPLNVFYRMHSVGALMEMAISAGKSQTAV